MLYVVFLQVKARDADGSSPNNRVVYRIQRGASDKFVIESRTGVVSVANGSQLDPDKTTPKSNRYTLTVVCCLHKVLTLHTNNRVVHTYTYEKLYALQCMIKNPDMMSKLVEHTRLSECARLVSTS